MIEAVVFDWGGTLSVFADVDMVDMWRLAARHLAPDREDELTALLAEVEGRTWERVKRDQRSSTLSEILAMASSEIRLDVAEAVLEEAALHHLDSWTPHIVHDQDAAPVLAALKSEGIAVGLLSNTHWPRTFHEHFLERDGLAELIDARLYTSEMTHTKPHPNAFRAALKAVGATSATNVVFVGDRPYDDVFGAKAMGMKAVLRPNRFVPDFEVEPDGVIELLPELLPLVEGWR